MKQISLKKGESAEIHLTELDIASPRLREMILTLCVMANGEIHIGTVMTGSKIESARIHYGAAELSARFSK
jgi:hypothetical protein